MKKLKSAQQASVHSGSRAGIKDDLERVVWMAHTIEEMAMQVQVELIDLIDSKD